MNFTPVYQYQTPSTDKKENVLAGIVGAFLFSLAGGALWVVLYLVNFYAGLSGLVAAVCAVTGYKIFAGKLSKKGVIIAVVIALLVLVLAWYGCFVNDLHSAYKEWYAAGEVDEMPTFFECFRMGPLYLSQPEIAKGYFIDLLIGLAFAFIGSIRYIMNTFKSVSAANAPGVQYAGQNPGAQQNVYNQQYPYSQPYNMQNHQPPQDPQNPQNTPTDQGDPGNGQ